jgi:hypothetical protein
MSRHLPTEILQHILSFIPHGRDYQRNVASFCLVSRVWYAAGIAKLYTRPRLTGKNFDAFIRTVCPSINAHIRRSDLAEFIHFLDMSELVHSGSKSLTARVLGRVKDSLKFFVAPAATFSLIAFSALAKCHGLQVLNLEFVIDRIDVAQLVKAIAKLPKLKQLHIRSCDAPRDWKKLFKKDKEEPSFPASLHHLTVSSVCQPNGVEVIRHTLDNSTVRSMRMVYSPFNIETNPFTTKSLRDLYELEIESTTTIQDDFIVHLLEHCPNLIDLTIPINCILELFFETDETSLTEHPLEVLKITSSTAFSDYELSGWDVRDVAEAATEYLTNLRELIITEDVAGKIDRAHGKSSYLDDLDEILETREEEAEKRLGPEYKKRNAGVFIIDP